MPLLGLLVTGNYLLSNEFVLYSDHQAFKYLQSQKRLTDRWVEFLQTFMFVLRHRPGEDNKVAYALSHVANLLHTLSIQVLGFDRTKSVYSSCPEFGIFYSQWIFFRGVHLCIPHASFQDLLVWEMHAGGSAGHLGRDKTIALVEDRFY